jgi:hypothetical protein
LNMHRGLCQCSALWIFLIVAAQRPIWIGIYFF